MLSHFSCLTKSPLITWVSVTTPGNAKSVENNFHITALQIPSKLNSSKTGLDYLRAGTIIADLRMPRTYENIHASVEHKGARPYIY